MRRRVHAGPHRLPETLQIEDRERLSAAEHLIENVRDLLRHRAMLLLGARLETLVKTVGKVLDVENCHTSLRFPPNWRHSRFPSIFRFRSARSLSPRKLD